MRQIDRAVQDLTSDFSDDRWFIEHHWPENANRIRAVLRDAVEAKPAAPPARALDVGCFNGYVAYLLTKVGYEVTGIDWEYGLHPAAESVGVNYRAMNLNALDDWKDWETGSFDVVWMGEIIEHVFNHPAGLMREVARILRRGGVLLMTTPNPSTAMNALRLLRNQSLGGGADRFMDLPKVTAEGLSTDEGIHYWEYRDVEIRRLLDSSGFRVEKHSFMALDAPNAAIMRRIGKLIVSSWSNTRLFGPIQYIFARRT